MKYDDPEIEAKHRRRAQIRAKFMKEVGLELFYAHEDIIWKEARQFNLGVRPPEPRLSFEEAKDLICEEFEKMYGITIWDYCQQNGPIGEG